MNKLLARVCEAGEKQYSSKIIHNEFVDGNLCDNCGKEIEVLSFRPYRAYRGPDSLDFSTARARADQMARDGTLYQTIQLPNDFKNALYSKLSLAGDDCSPTVLLCEKCSHLISEIAIVWHQARIRRAEDELRVAKKELADNLSYYSKKVCDASKRLDERTKNHVISQPQPHGEAIAIIEAQPEPNTKNPRLKGLLAD